MEEQTCLPRYAHHVWYCFACFYVSLLVRSKAYSFFMLNCMSWSHGDLTWLRLFQAVGNLNVDAQSLMLATVAKGLVGLGYEVEVSFHTAPFHVDCKKSSSLVIMPLGCALELQHVTVW